MRRQRRQRPMILLPIATSARRSIRLRYSPHASYLLTFHLAYLQPSLVLAQSVSQSVRCSLQLDSSGLACIPLALVCTNIKWMNLFETKDDFTMYTFLYLCHRCCRVRVQVSERVRFASERASIQTNAYVTAFSHSFIPHSYESDLTIQLCTCLFG